MRIDINLPVVKGRIAANNLRLQMYARIIEICSEYSGIVLMSHQGRKGDPDFISLEQHFYAIDDLLPRDVSVDFVPYERMFAAETKRKISKLKEKEVLILDNVRNLDEETRPFNAADSTYVKNFKGLIKTCVNDSIPTWHRDNASLMCLPYISDQTFIGLRSSHELKVLEEARESDYSKALIMGGVKLQKYEYLMRILNDMEVFTGGLVGQLIAKAEGADLGETNERFLGSRFTAEDLEKVRRMLKYYDIRHPIDFVVENDGKIRNVAIEDMKHIGGIIMDIGNDTVDLYASELQKYRIRIRAGPLGVFEKGYDNGIRLTKMIAGEGMYFLGGDTSQEIVQNKLDAHLTAAGAEILLAGGAGIAILANEELPCLEYFLSHEISSRET